MHGGGGVNGVAAHAILFVEGSEVIGFDDALEARASHDTSQGITTRGPGLHCIEICPLLEPFTPALLKDGHMLVAGKDADDIVIAACPVDGSCVPCQDHKMV